MATPAELQQIYLAYFGRPADTDGIAFYAGTPVSTVVQFFSASPESQSLYGATFTAASVKAIYTYLFNRPAADSEAAFWVGVVNAPGSTVSPAAAALTILQSAHNDDAVGINNKLAVAAVFTNALTLNLPLQTLGLNYTGSAAADAVRKFIATVGSASDAVGLASAEVQSQLLSILHGASLTKPAVVPANGSQYTLTAGIDVVIGTDASETIVATGGPKGTYASSDVISGGGGIDTLSMVPGAPYVTMGDVSINNLTGVERLSVTNADSVFLGLQVSGLTDVINSGSDDLRTTTFQGLSGNVNVSVLNTRGSTTLHVASAALAGSADAANVTLSGTGSTPYTTYSQALTLAASAPNANEYEAVNILSTGGSGNSMLLATDKVQTSLKTLNIAGTASLVLHLAADNTPGSVSTIDASATTGSVTVGEDFFGVTLGAGDHRITLGAGNDTVFFGAGLDAGDTVDGGAGTDTIGISTAVTAAMLAHVTNVEAVRFDLRFGNIVQDAGLAALAGFNYAMVGFNSLTLNNLASGSTTIVAGNSAALTETLRDGSGASDSLSLTFDSGSPDTGTTLATLGSVAGLETLRIVSNGNAPVGPGFGAAYANIIGTDQITAAHVVSGVASLTISSPLLASSFDASALSGNLTVTLGSTATALRSGSGADTIQLGVVGANSSIGASVVTVGAGIDTIRFAASNPAGTGAATGYGGFVEITDFSLSAGDQMQFSRSATDFSLRDASGTVHTGLSSYSSWQAVAQNASVSVGPFAPMILKLSTGVAFSTNVATTFANALGTGSVTGLLLNGNYVVTAYDTGNSKAIVAVVNTGANAAGNTALTAADFTAGGVAVVGVFDMTATDYSHFAMPQNTVVF
jgi:hypothetical protein